MLTRQNVDLSKYRPKRPAKMLICQNFDPPKCGLVKLLML
jgi:hypothetical protein